MRALLDETVAVEVAKAYRGVGSAAYEPALMLRIAVWEVQQGRRSPAQWFRDTRENRVVQWLAHGIRPSRTALYAFRDRMGKVIQEVHATMVRRAIADGLLEPREAVQDGTLVRARASRHRQLNLTVLARRRAELAAAMALDDSGQPAATVPRWMAQTVAGRRQMRAKYARAQVALAERMRKNARRPKSKQRAAKHVTVCPSDPEAPIGRDKEKVFTPLYNWQCLVEPTSLVIVAFDVFAQATDTGTLAPMLDQAQWVIGRPLDAVSADAGYANLLDLQDCIARGVTLYAPVQANAFTEAKRQQRAATQPPRLDRDQFTWDDEAQTYICPQGHALRHDSKERKHRRDDEWVTEHRFRCPPTHCGACPLRDRCVTNPAKGRTIKRLEGQELLDELRARMATPPGQAKSKRRGQVIERAFADAKEHRQLRRLHGHGRHRARAEIGLVVLAQNTLTILRLRQASKTPNESKT